MTKKELIQILHDEVNNHHGRVDCTAAQCEAVLDALVDVMTEELRAGEPVQLINFGKFEVGERAARMGRNPKTGEKLPIPAQRVVKFKVSGILKDIVARG